MTGRLARGVPIPLAMLFGVLVFGSALPRGLQLAAEAALVAAALLMAGDAFNRRRSASALALGCMGVTVYWLALSFNSNVPNTAVALLGLRKSALVLSGLAIGLAWPAGGNPGSGQRYLARLLLVGGVASLCVRWFLPDVEARIAGDAPNYTAVFAGQLRLHGIYAGPFHVALLGSFLAVEGWRRIANRGASDRRIALESYAFLGVGLMVVYVSQVRAAYLTVAIGIAAVSVFGRARSISSARLSSILKVFIFGALVVMVAGTQSDAALSSLTQLGSDQRALGRTDTWAEALDMIADSPLFGWGPGSAGDGLGRDFAPGRHVTSHNLVLKYAVEGGLLGAIMCASIVLGVLRLMKQAPRPLGEGFAAVICMASMGLSGSTVEAIPISIILSVLIGLEARRGSAAAAEFRQTDPEVERVPTI